MPPNVKPALAPPVILSAFVFVRDWKTETFL